MYTKNLKMKNFKKNKYYFMNPIIKDIIFIDGVSRSGKLLLGTLISSFKRMESLEFGENFEHFSSALSLKKCNYDFAKSYLCNYINQLIYYKMLSRNVNFRPSDRTGIQNYYDPKLYKKRLKVKEGDKVIERIKSTQPMIPFVTHEIMTNFKLFNKLNIRVKFVSIYRSPIELAYSWIKRGLGTRWGKDPRMFTLLINKGNKPYPWFLHKNFPKEWGKLNQYERSIYYVLLLTTRSVAQQKKIKNKKLFFVTSYDKIVRDTPNELRKISKFLNTNFSKKTHQFIRKEKCPNKYSKDDINFKKNFLKKNVKKKIFEKLLVLENKYNKNLYGL